MPRPASYATQAPRSTSPERLAVVLRQAQDERGQNHPLVLRQAQDERAKTTRSSFDKLRMSGPELPAHGELVEPSAVTAEAAEEGAREHRARARQRIISSFGRLPLRTAG